MFFLSPNPQELAEPRNAVDPSECLLLEQMHCPGFGEAVPISKAMCPLDFWRVNIRSCSQQILGATVTQLSIW